ncbi:MAG: hypothetical protein HOW73_13700 [Polyangiaceae bacterium]|nr:hypothetical protein [Polyangiaceae bacterium]
MVSDVLLNGDRIYAAVQGIDIQAFSLQDGAAQYLGHSMGPQGVCAVDCPDVLSNLTLSGDTIFATSFMSGAIRVVDDGSGNLGAAEVLPVGTRARGLALSAGAGDYIFVGTDAGLNVHPTSAAANAAPIYAEQNGWGIVRGITGEGETLYAASGGRGLLTYDLSLNLVDTDTTPGIDSDYGGFGVYLHDGLLFFADARAGFSIFDVSTPANPASVSQVADPDFDAIDGAVFSGTTAFVCDGNNSVRSYDISVPSAPVLLDKAFVNDTAGGCLQLALQGTVLYVAGSAGLGLIDATDPASLVVAKTLTLPSREGLLSLAVSGATLYGSAFDVDLESGTDSLARTLVAFDITNPSDPVQIYEGADIGLGQRLVARGGKLYASAGPTGVHVFDIESGSEPHLEGTIEGIGNTYWLHFTDDTMFVSARGAGVIPVRVGKTE